MQFEEYLSHSATHDGRTQSLVDHSIAVAETASKFMDKFGHRTTGLRSGIYHDIGKSRQSMQGILNGKPGPKVPHAIFGAHLLGGVDIISSWIVLSHHTRLLNLNDFKAELKEYARSPFTDLPSDVNGLVEHIIEKMGSSPLDPPTNEKDPLKVDLHIRMGLSSLVDADRSNAEAHFHPHRAETRKTWPSLPELLERFQRNLGSAIDLPRCDGARTQTVIDVRNSVYEQCMRAAEMPPAMRTLTAPTGAAKSLASIGMGLHHAVKFDLERVIYISPLISITDQTAEVCKRLIGEDGFLEHHSSIDMGSPDGRTWLAAENWDVPFIVSTMAQLLETLFSDSPGKLRKFHNLGRSFIIVDEWQQIPIHLLAPTLLMMWQLVRDYGSSILLMTATRPYELKFMPDGVTIEEVIDDPASMFEAMRRVRYEILYDEDGRLRKMEPKQIAEMMMEHHQAMVVANTKDDAERLLRCLPEGVRFHLSSDMCPAHRKKVIAEVQRRLRNGEPCYLSCTQVVEAGVNLDFPFVVRICCPMTNLHQAAGRANRDGTMEYGVVVFVDLVGGKMPDGAYRSGADTTRNMVRADHDIDIHSIDAHREYYRRLFMSCSTDSKGITQLRRELRFEDVAAAYRLIEDDGVAVAVPWEDGEALIGEMQEAVDAEEEITMSDIRRLQPYIVQASQAKFMKMVESGQCSQIADGLWRWDGEYDDEVGI